MYVNVKIKKWYLYFFLLLCVNVSLYTNDRLQNGQDNAVCYKNQQPDYNISFDAKSEIVTLKKSVPWIQGREHIWRGKQEDQSYVINNSADNENKRLFKGTESFKIETGPRILRKLTEFSGDPIHPGSSSLSSSQYSGVEDINYTLENVSSANGAETFQNHEGEQQDKVYVVRAEPKIIDVNHLRTVQQDTSSENTEADDEKPAVNQSSESSMPTSPSDPNIVANDEVLGSEVQSEHQEESTYAPPAQQEDIPSFREWTEKHLAEEEEKGNKDNNTNATTVVKRIIPHKNFASVDCGAKVLATNPEAKSAGSVLSPSRDEYLLSACNSRIWFVVELCEAVQVKRIELANFELFSSSPKEFSVSVSDRFPSRDWSDLGNFVAKDEKSIQSFDLHPHHFTKYIRVDIHSHYGKEHFCPISLFRVYGTSELEVLETVDGNLNLEIIDGEEELLESSQNNRDDEEPNEEEGHNMSAQNIFGSARDALFNVVKKAAEALVISPSLKKTISPTESADTGQSVHSLENNCVTPRYYVLCANCSESFFNKVYSLISCKMFALTKTLLDLHLWRSLERYNACSSYGISIKANHTDDLKGLYILNIFPEEVLAAFCNLLAISRSLTSVNVTHTDKLVLQTETERLVNVTLESLFTTTDQQVIAERATQDSKTFKIIDSTAPCGTDFSAEIKPTKTFDKEPEETLQLIEPKDEQRSTVVAVPQAPAVIKSAETVPIVTTSEETGGVKTVKEVIEHSGEVADDSLSIDSIISELERTTNDSQNVTLSSVSARDVKPQAQKESVFVRLANRIKALEKNMSLSGQYLEELSRRYKRQVEDMQKLLTEAHENRQKNKEREEKRQLEMNLLMEQIATLTMTVESLIDERASWKYKAWSLGEHSLIVLLELFILLGFVILWRGVPSMEISRRKISLAWDRSRQNSDNDVMKRRKSENDILHDGIEKSLKRRPSEEALRIDGSAHYELLIADHQVQSTRNETKRKRKKRKELVQKSLENAMNLEAGNSSNTVYAPNKRRHKENSPIQRCSSASEIMHTSTLITPTEGHIVEERMPPPPPSYMKTALSTRNKRSESLVNGNSATSTSNGTLSEVSSTSSTPAKEKRGGFKKMMRKFL